MVQDGIKIVRVTDSEIVKHIAVHPKIFRWLTDDSSLDPELWQPPMSRGVIWLGAVSGDNLFGWGGFFPKTGITVETHFAFLPEGWGGAADRAFLQMISWVRLHTSFKRLVGEIPRANRLAIRFALRAGCVPYGVNEKSIRRGGQVEDLVCFGLNL